MKDIKITKIEIKEGNILLTDSDGGQYIAEELEYYDSCSDPYDESILCLDMYMFRFKGPDGNGLGLGCLDIEESICASASWKSLISACGDNILEYLRDTKFESNVRTAIIQGKYNNLVIEYRLNKAFEITGRAYYLEDKEMKGEPHTQLDFFDSDQVYLSDPIYSRKFHGLIMLETDYFDDLIRLHYATDMGIRNPHVIKEVVSYLHDFNMKNLHHLGTILRDRKCKSEEDENLLLVQFLFNITEDEAKDLQTKKTDICTFLVDKMPQWRIEAESAIKKYNLN